MEITAFSKSVQVAPRKVRLVADAIRRQNIDVALMSLVNLRKRGAGVLEKALRSAIANAADRKVNRETLFIKSIDVMDGAAYKRFHPSTRGRTHPYKKRTSHIRIVLTDEVQVSNKKLATTETQKSSQKHGKEKDDGTKS